MSDFLRSAAPEYPDPERIVRTTVPLSGFSAGRADHSRGARTPVEPGIGGKYARHPFEAYIVGYPDGNMTSATVEVYRGTVRSTDYSMTPTTITGIDSQFTMTSTNDWLYLECDFNSSGSLTAVELKSGGTFGGSLAAGGGGSYKWYHPIAHVRAIKTGKSGSVDNGEWEQIKTGFFIAQKTNTHLAVAYHYPNPFASDSQYPMLVPAPGAED